MDSTGIDGFVHAACFEGKTYFNLQVLSFCKNADLTARLTLEITNQQVTKAKRQIDMASRSLIIFLCWQEAHRP